jgi:hypothetical protein
MDLYTKNGKPLQVANDFVYSRSGVPVGRIRGERVFGPDGRYVGSIVGDRLVAAVVEIALGTCFAIGHRNLFVWQEHPKRSLVHDLKRLGIDESQERRRHRQASALGVEQRTQ